MFAVFILACGTTHLISILDIWQPVYWLDASVKTLTAAASLATAVVIWPLMPKALALPSPMQLDQANRNLVREIAARQEAERQLRALTHELEQRVATRTAEFESVNDALRRKVAEHERAELAIRDSQQQLQSIVDNAATVISVKQADRRYVLVNRRFEDVFHVRRQDAFGKTDAQLFSAERAAASRQADDRVLAGDVVETEETVILGGQLHTFLSVNFPIRDSGGRIVSIGGISTDISERKRAEERLRLVVEASPNAMVMVSHGGRIVLVNSQTERVFGYSRDELIGRSIETLVPARFRDQHPDHRAAFLAAPKSRPMGAGRHLYGLRSDGSELPVEIGLNPIETDEGMFVLAAIVDITERTRAETALRERTDELARSNRDLEQFAYVASHDLQEPLRAVAGPLQLLQRRYQGQLDARADEYIGHAVEGATRMQALIEDLLTYSRVGRSDNPFQPVQCAVVLDSALNNLAVALEEAGADVHRGLLPTVQAIPSQLALLFQNLLGNAVKFRRKDGPLRIRVGAEPCADGWLFRVEDNGIGIDAQYFERIFLIFQRLHTRRDYPGTGIGLALCKRIVERHGGRIWVESEPGNGTTFLFTLPGGAGTGPNAEVI
ncbi:TPA: PAS domain S-box protein [Burkholderia stabilis]|nr:PAS domain S-box protein [Burkholderia stabilis]HDR9524325.1 PAS domain S-box protein [Burkholderia stabilis]HDR9541482.1 PAS domain S-box protein [Burkholderia stabilis]HDR9571298.1 PAS domain S-box protein [Burkholderia stabilis]HDR9579560.1 PAS domain S-box protein [Burkholderia stabilis]